MNKKKEASILRDYFELQGYNAHIVKGYDPEGKAFYNLVFVDITPEEHEKLEQDERLNDALAKEVVTGVAFFEQGWKHDILKIHLYQGVLYDKFNKQTGREKWT